MGDDILSWLDDTIQHSAFQWEFIQANIPYDPNGWYDIFSASLQEYYTFSGHGILLTGTDNYGKQSAAVQMLRLLTSDAYAYEPVFLDGAELASCSAEQTKARLRSLQDRFYDDRKGLCLVLEGMEDCPIRRELLVFLGQRMCQYRMYSEELTPMALILIDDREADIPALLRGHLRLYRCNLPNRSQRMKYLENIGESLKKYLSLELFATATEGASYAQLQDMISAVGSLIDSQDLVKLPDAQLTDFLHSQMPPFPEDPAAEKICSAIQQLTEQLPQLLANIPQAQPGTAGKTVGSAVETAEDITSADSFDLKKERKRIEALPSWELAEELFGKDGIAHILNKEPLLQ